MAEEDNVCQFVGEPMSDIAGIGILVGFTGQAVLSLGLSLWVFFLSRHGKLDKALHDEDSDELAIEMKRLDMVQDILMIGNDIQMMTGIALMITAYAYGEHIDVYHLHLIYDTVSLVGHARNTEYRKRREGHGRSELFGIEEGSDTRHQPSAPEQLFRQLLRLVLPSVQQNPILRKFCLSGRYRVTYTFVAFYVALTVVLAQQLNAWDWQVDGRCYDTSGTTAPGAAHPRADRTYVSITCGWMVAVMLFAVFGGARLRRGILLAAFVQFPVHLYMMLALRTANQGRLGVTAEEAAAAGADERSEASENEWDFGQTTAVLLLGVAIGEFLAKSFELYRFERKIKRRQRGVGARELLRPDERDEQQQPLRQTVTEEPTKRPATSAQEGRAGRGR